MGTILTSYGDAGYEHEGYPAQILDDGSITGTYSTETRARMIGQVIAACGCGWTGTTRYPTTGPFDEAAEELALQEWEHEHARPALARHQGARWDQLRMMLQLLGAADDQLDLLDQLDLTLSLLRRATELAQDLRDHLATEDEGR